MTQQTDLPKLAGLREEQRTAADRILNSAPFRRAPRLREMLSYILECTIDGRFDDLTEMRIAERVFGRPDYNPSEENLVRVSARQLRAKMAEFYESEGRHDDVQVDVPKGAYCAHFRDRRGQFQPPAPAVLSATPINVAPARSTNWLAISLGIFSLSLIVLSVNLWRETRAVRAATPTAHPTLFNSLLSNPGQRTNIVVTDSAVVLLDKLLHRYTTVDDYASDRYLQVGPRTDDADQTQFLDMLRQRQICSFADMRILALLFQAYPQESREFALHHARNMHARDFSNGDNFVLLGTPMSNPWAELFQDSVNFRTLERVGELCFENEHPLAGEQKMYCSENQRSEQGTDYAHIVLRHNASGNARILLIAGLDMEATEAAGEFFLNPQSAPDVLKAFHGHSLQDLPDYELLLKSYSIGGTGREAKIVSARSL